MKICLKKHKLCTKRDKDMQRRIERVLGEDGEVVEEIITTRKVTKKKADPVPTKGNDDDIFDITCQMNGMIIEPELAKVEPVMLVRARIAEENSKKKLLGLRERFDAENVSVDVVLKKELDDLNAKQVRLMKEIGMERNRIEKEITRKKKLRDTLEAQIASEEVRHSKFAERVEELAKKNDEKTTKSAKSTKVSTGPKPRSQRRNLNQAQRRKLWDTYIGKEHGIASCMCCGVTEIQVDNFHAGHVQADANGGSMDLNNLRPICQSCNNSMGTRNMAEFMESSGLGTLSGPSPMQVDINLISLLDI